MEMIQTFFSFLLQHKIQRQMTTLKVITILLNNIVVYIVTDFLRIKISNSIGQPSIPPSDELLIPKVSNKQTSKFTDKAEN